MQVQPPEVIQTMTKLNQQFAHISVLQNAIRESIQEVQMLVEASAAPQSEEFQSVLQRVNLVKHELCDIENILHKLKQPVG